MQDTTDNKSIKHTLNVIRQALEDKEEDQENSTDNILILNKLVKEGVAFPFHINNVLHYCGNSKNHYHLH